MHYQSNKHQNPTANFTQESDAVSFGGFQSGRSDGSGTFPLTKRGEVVCNPLRWASVSKTAQLYSEVISEQALRSLIWLAEAYEKAPKEGLKSNGFLPVIVRPPNQRKVLIDLVEFEKWLTSRQRQSQREEHLPHPNRGAQLEDARPARRER